MRKKQANESRYQELFDLWKAGEYACLVIQARRFLDDFPNHVVAWTLYGVGLYEIACYDNSLQALLNSIKLRSKKCLHYSYTQLGHLYREKGEYRKSAQWYRKAIKLNPEDAGPRIFLGAIQAKQGMLDSAEKTHRRATLCKKGSIEEAYLNLGLVLRAKERLEEALVCFEKALDLDPKYCAAQDAKTDVTKAIELLRENQ